MVSAVARDLTQPLSTMHRTGCNGQVYNKSWRSSVHLLENLLTGSAMKGNTTDILWEVLSPVFEQIHRNKPKWAVVKYT